VVIKISGQDEDGLADWALHGRVFADGGFADVANVVSPASFEVAEAKTLVLQVLLLAQTHLQLAQRH
jgi:hypothetical protein